MVYFCYSLVFNCVWLVSKRVVYYHPFFVPSRNQVQTRPDHKSNCKMYDRSWTLGMLLCCTVALIKTSVCAVAKLRCAAADESSTARCMTAVRLCTGPGWCRCHT